MGGQEAALYALFCVLAKFPQLQGQILFFAHEWRGQPTRLIEYREARTEHSLQ
jgi:hypothetical protein